MGVALAARICLSLLVLLVVACDFRKEDTAREIGSVTPIYKHDNTSGWTVSGDGKLLAIALPENPPNELLVLNLVQKVGWRLTGPQLNIKLAHPAFSPDGKFLALVATPSPYFGVGEIMVIELPGKIVFAFAEDQRSYAHPAFSPDGQQLAYFRDVDPLESLGSAKLPPNQREWHAYSVFHRKIGSTSAQQLTSAAFAGPCGILFGSDRIHYCASSALEKMARTETNVGVWRFPSPDSPLSKITEDRFSYVIDENEQELPVPYAPEGLARAFPSGFLSDGRIVFRTSKNFETRLTAYDGIRSEQLESLSAPNVASVKLDDAGNTYWRLENVSNEKVQVKLIVSSAKGAQSEISLDKFAIENVALQDEVR